MSAGSPLGSRVVWIVDDSPLEAELARATLGPAYTTRLFLDGAQVLEQLATPPLPDVLVLDWVMPGVSGIEVCQFLRAHEATAELPILLLTARHQTEQVVEGLGAGANDFLCKPYAPAELVARVNSLVRARHLRERAERAERSLRALLEHLPDPLLTSDAQGIITFVNAEAERALSIASSATVGRPLGDLFPALGALHEARFAGEDFQALPELTFDGRLLTPAVRRLELEGVPTLALTLRDVTEKRRLEERRLDFYSMVAHDLRAPLAAMRLRVDLMAQEQHGPLSARYREDLGKLTVRITEMVALINDFLDIARSEGVGLSLAREPLDVGTLVERTLTGFADLAPSQGVTLRFQAPKAPVVAQADPARVAQVLTNLVSNAVKFSPAGGEVRVDLARRDAEVEVSVSDEGRGIAEEQVGQLFQRYSRPGTDAALPGTGLGLMIVREIVTAHGGTCGVESTPGAGSRFWFRLPAG